MDELNITSAFSSKGNMFLTSPLRTLGQRIIVASGLWPRVLLSRTIRRSSLLSVVDPWSDSSKSRADIAEM